MPPGALYAKSFGGSARQQDTARDVSQPLGAVTPEDHHALVVPYRRACRPRTTGGPPHTLHTGGSAALAQAAADVADCRFRMLTPREHLRAQRFPDGYVVLGNKGEQTMQAGNAVSVNVAQWIGERVRCRAGRPPRRGGGVTGVRVAGDRAYEAGAARPGRGPARRRARLTAAHASKAPDRRERP